MTTGLPAGPCEAACSFLRSVKPPSVPRLLFLLAFALYGLALCGPARAVEAVRVPLDSTAIDLTSVVERYGGQGDRIQISTAPGTDGIVRRIEVGAKQPGTKPNWIVFALTNDTDEQIERLLVAPHFRLVGSGLVWPDLGATRISAITASQGFAPEAQDNLDADVFRVTLDPGATVTYVAELRTPNLPQLYLWAPDAYKDQVTSLSLYKGIVIGIAGLLALFLTIVFVVRGAAIFPAAAALAWAVLGYVCIDFGFWHKLFTIGGETDRVSRSVAEAVLAATLFVFLFAYLHLNRWHVRYRHIGAAWLLFLAALVCFALVDAPVAAGVARIMLATVAVVGFILVIYLSTHGYDRAVMLIPTWFLLLVWVGAAGLTVTGTLSNDLVSPALMGGLVLIVMLIGFTIMQNAFSGSGLGHGAVSDSDRKALALTGSGDMIFDWDVAADRVFVSPEIEHQLGLRRGSLEGPAASWFELLHGFDRERFRACLDTILEQRCGRISQFFRLRATDGHYFWFALKARPVVGNAGEVMRVVGTLTDVTDTKVSEERMLHDAVHDSLTGLPNRELFFDRLDAALMMGRGNDEVRPSVMTLDIDRFKHVNEQVGPSVGDSILLTIARRVGRLLRQQDTMARIGSDQFAFIILSEQNPEAIKTLAETLRRTLGTPVTLGEHEVALTCSVGLALFDPQLHATRENMLQDAEIALARAKRTGGNKMEVFRPSMRAQRSDRFSIEADLKRAVERNEIKVHFPADRAARGPHDRRVRGPVAMDPPAARPRAAGRVHPGRRTERAHRGARDVRARSDGPGTRRLATGPRRVAPHLCVGEHLVAPTAAARPPQRREGRADPLRRAPQLAEARTHREPGHGEPGIRRPDAVAHPRSRGRLVARRFRHRLFVAVLSAALSVRYDQDRPVLRAPERQRQPPYHSAVHRDPGPRSRHGSRGGRGRIRKRRDRTLATRLRICARLRVRTTDQRRRSQEACRRRERGRLDPKRGRRAAPTCGTTIPRSRPGSSPSTPTPFSFTGW